MNIESLPHVRALPSNSNGRDFVVGDLHGCFDLLDRLLDAVRFDPACDRLFSVGDLVDRGPDSLRCMSFLEAPWFHAVKGNHESMLLEYFESYLSGGGLDDWAQVTRSDMWLNGGEWIASCYQANEARMSPMFDRLLEKIGTLPLVWVVGEGQDRFHVLHAELVHPDYRKSRQKVWLDADIDGWVAGGKIDALTQERLVWGRTLMMMLASPALPAMQPGLSTTYCGHTIDMWVRSYLSHVCLDTGAYRSLEEGGFGLTLHSIHQQRQLRASYGSVNVVEVRSLLSA
ncbi:MAG: serine/threonine protein phosphatase 1 [Pseudomonadota bacterium]|nr:serine/threonine protein phosphatase 1 [Pseudomonadota bacterium]